MQNVAFHHPEMQNRVFCLYRVSTLGQVDKLRDDIPMQRQACHAYIAQQGWNFVDELSEKGVSGFKVSAKDRDEIQKIQTGFKKAVKEEVKSQRMKTELITNVSHDLKTPLTAITTYIELLKKEDITEEERRSYIDTLERKSMRLKVLIEDLFEVSKANSNNIVLNKMELDVVNLIKQVSIEHVDKMQQRGLELRWNVPE